mgnify:CR=1 FL=1
MEVTDLQLKKSLELMCAQRNCDRKKVKSMAKLFFMHPGKTAGRAIQDATTKTDKVFVLGHDDRCDGARRPCFVVLRDPVDRLVSALSFKRQGGEMRNERFLGNRCHAWLERRGPKCVAPFANERRVGLDELADAMPDEAETRSPAS